jgi:hypothetical protein
MRVVLMYDFGICHRGKYADRPLLQSMILAFVVEENMLTARCFNLCFWRLLLRQQNVGTCAARPTAFPHNTRSLTQ